VQWMVAVVLECSATIDSFGIEAKLQVNQQSEQESCCDI